MVHVQSYPIELTQTGKSVTYLDQPLRPKTDPGEADEAEKDPGPLKSMAYD